MICSLPPEILDIVVDHLHDQPTALRACCLVSKSWVPRSRIHLFALVEFTDTSAERWVYTFPDPLNSPAHYTRTLTICSNWLLTDPGLDVARRICIFPFHNVAHLTLVCRPCGGLASLVPFHGLSPAIRSLRLALPHTKRSEVFGLICSFPVLEDLDWFIFSYRNGVDEWIPPSTSPSLTGSLELRSVVGGISPITRRLLDLPNGLNFTKIVLSCIDCETDFKSTTDLVSGCSDTLESLDVSNQSPDLSTAGLFNLSAATKLKQLVFQCGRSNVQWVTEALQTIKSKNLQRITVRPVPGAFLHTIEEPVRQQWHDLDRLLVQFWASHSIRPKVTYEAGMRKKDIRDYTPTLLPELTKRGLVDLVEYKR